MKSAIYLSYAHFAGFVVSLVYLHIEAETSKKIVFLSPAGLIATWCVIFIFGMCFYLSWKMERSEKDERILDNDLED